jgi:hypothetical protein
VEYEGGYLLGRISGASYFHHHDDEAVSTSKSRSVSTTLHGETSHNTVIMKLVLLKHTTEIMPISAM